LAITNYNSPVHPIVYSLLLGLTAALANVFGGAIIVQKHWERRFLRYFVALGAGFMLATSLLEMVPESVRLNPGMAGMFILLDAPDRIRAHSQRLFRRARADHSHVL
jgi:zinc transporter ZupT